MPKNVRFFHAPVMMTSAARMTLMRLNRVQMFSMRSSLTDLVLSSVLTFTFPAAMRSSTSDAVSPRSPKGFWASMVFIRSHRFVRRGGDSYDEGHERLALATPGIRTHTGSRKIRMVRHIGFEPTAFCSGGRRSNPLS